VNGTVSNVVVLGSQGLISVYGGCLGGTTGVTLPPGLAPNTVSVVSSGQVNVSYYTSDPNDPPVQSSLTLYEGTFPPVSTPLSTTTCAVPVRLRQYSPAYCNTVTGKLSFVYVWDSLSGNKADLATCQIRERVLYDNNGVPPSPPFPSGPGSSFPNPTVQPAPTDPPIVRLNGSAQTAPDNHYPPTGFYNKPYSLTFFNATQFYEYNCACQNTPNWTSFPDFNGIPIVRSVQNPSGTWIYNITKSGASCSIPISPQ
jgi:hypothetical protein